MRAATKNGSNGHADAGRIYPVEEMLIEKASGKAAKETSSRIEILPLKLEVVTLTIRGETPLIMHRFDDGKVNAMLRKHMGEAAQKRDKKVPENDFLASLHFIGKPPKLVKKAGKVSATGRWGFPAGGIRAAAISACRQVDGLKMTYARGCFHVLADDPGNNLVEVFGTPQMRRDVTRNANGAPDIRFRAEFPEWQMKLAIKYDTKCISPSQLANLFNQAGFSVGLGDWRPERDGSYGRFYVAPSSELMIKARA